jgi:hypothetical protein
MFDISVHLGRDQAVAVGKMNGFPQSPAALSRSGRLTNVSALNIKRLCANFMCRNSSRSCDLANHAASRFWQCSCP